MEKIKDYLFLHLCVALFSFTSVFSKLRRSSTTEAVLRILFCMYLCF